MPIDPGFLGLTPILCDVMTTCNDSRIFYRFTVNFELWNSDISALKQTPLLGIYHYKLPQASYFASHLGTYRATFEPMPAYLWQANISRWWPTDLLVRLPSHLLSWWHLDSLVHWWRQWGASSNSQKASRGPFQMRLFGDTPTDKVILSAESGLSQTLWWLMWEKKH